MKMFNFDGKFKNELTFERSMKTGLALLVTALAASGCGRELTHSQIIKELKNLQNGWGYTWERDLTNETNEEVDNEALPRNYSILTHYRSGGFTLGSVTQSVVGSDGFYVTDTNEDGKVDSLRIYGNGFIIYHPESVQFFENLTGEECQFNNLSSGMMDAGEQCRRLRGYRIAQEFYEKGMESFFERTRTIGRERVLDEIARSASFFDI